MMHVTHVGVFADPRRRPAGALLDAWPALPGLAGAVRAAGVRVTVVQAAAADERFTRDGIDFRFVAVPGTRRGARRIARVVRSLEPDAIHLRGLRFPLHVHALRRALPATPILLHHHADSPPVAPRAALERLLMRGADAAAFTTAAHARPFLHGGVLPRDLAIVEVPAASSTFLPGSRAAARRVLGVGGAPCIAWVGRLDAVKDPLTALDIVSRAARTLPGLRLWCAWTDAPMLDVVRDRVANDPALRQRVMLLGRLDRARVELLLRAADIFLATSLRESTGFALIEALACGAAPVATDIPAFRSITRGGRVGALVPPRDATAGAAALVEIARALPARTVVRRHFDENLGPRAIGSILRDAYSDMIVRRAHARLASAPRGPVRPMPVPPPVRAEETTRRMRVCMIVPGGVDRSGTHRVIPCILALIERLARRVELHVLALRQGPRPEEYALLGATVHCTPARSRSAGLRRLIALHRAAPFDVLHAFWMHPQGTAAAMAGALLRVPVLLHINGGDLADLRDIGFGGRATLMGRLRLRVAVAGADRVTVPSDAMLADARALGIVAHRITPGVVLDRWPVRAPRPRRHGEPLGLLAVGTVNAVKDHGTLLRAVALLRSRGIDARLDVAGEDLSSGAVAELAASLDLDDVVRFHGFVPHDRLRRLYDDAHVLVVSSRHEADPIAALEAAVAGVAVAGTHVGHLVEWAPDGATTCPPGDPAALAGILARLAHDDALRMRTAHFAQRRALHRDADRAADAILATYDELGRRRGGD